MEIQSQPPCFIDDNDQKVVAFFHEVKRELGITSTRRVAAIITRVLSGIRRILKENEVAELIKSTPSLLQLLLVSNWKYEEGNWHKTEHLDEFVDSLFYEDRHQQHTLFHSQIETLNAVLVVLKKLDKMLGILNFPGLSYSLVQEIRQAALFEDAAIHTQ